VLTDEEISALTQWGTPPRRNFTAEQWRGITARLPSGATPMRQALFVFLVAANSYWEDAAGPTPRERARLVAEAVEHLKAAMEKIHAATRHRHSELKKLSQVASQIEWDRDDMRFLPEVDPRFHRREFLAVALNLWMACGGRLRLSRSRTKPTGPLIRYLVFVSELVMGKDAPTPETLAAFVRDEKAMWKGPRTT
jgi:hypothetical protein